jgi:hypothetical protein
MHGRVSEKTSAMSTFNPYDAPNAELPTGKYAGEQGMWREGKILVMSKGTVFPDRCVKCDAPAEGYRLNRDLSWHPSVWYLMIFFPGLLFYIIAAMIVRKTAKIRVPLCRRHRAARRRDIAIGWLGSLGGIAMFIGGFTVGDSLPEAGRAGLVIGGIVLLLAPMIYGSLRARVVVPTRIDESMVWLKGVGPEFLAALPDAAAHANAAWIEPANPKAEDKLEIVEDFREL